MRRAIACLVVVSLATGACSGDGGTKTFKYCAEKMKGDILVGLMLSYKGSLATLGPFLDQGVALALTEINAQGGINGKTLGYVACDDATDENVAALATVELLDNWKVGAIIGPISSRCAVGMFDLMVAHKVVMISPVNQLPSLITMEDDGYYYRTCAAADIQVPAIAQICREAGWTRPFVFHQDDTYGNMMFRLFKDDLISTGGEAQEFVYRESDEQYAAKGVQAAQAAYAPDEPDVLIQFNYVEDMGTMLRALAGVGWIPTNGKPWIMATGMKHPELIRMVGIENLIGGMGTIPLADVGKDYYATWEADFTEMWGAPPFDFSPNAYDAAYLVAIAMAFSDDPTNGTQIRDNLQKTHSGAIILPKQWDQVLAHLADGEVNYEGVSGNVDFDEMGGVSQNIKQWQIQPDESFETIMCWQPGAIKCPGW